MTTGPRPMEPAEQEAFTLHMQRVPVETIEEKTGLSRPRIAAAIDLGRLHARIALQPAAAAPAPAAPAPPRVRMAAVRQLPGATIAPSATLSEPTLLEPVAPVLTVPPQPAPKRDPRKPVKQPGKPADRDEKIRTLRAVIGVLRSQLAKNEAELAELLAAAPEPAPVRAPAVPPAPPAPVTSAAPATRPKASARPDPATSPEARAWAVAAGWAVPPDGERLPGAIVLAYLNAGGTK